MVIPGKQNLQHLAIIEEFKQGFFHPVLTMLYFYCNVLAVSFGQDLGSMFLVLGVILLINEWYYCRYWQPRLEAERANQHRRTFQNRNRLSCAATSESARPLAAIQQVIEMKDHYMIIN